MKLTNLLIIFNSLYLVSSTVMADSTNLTAQSRSTTVTPTEAQKFTTTAAFFPMTNDSNGISQMQGDKTSFYIINQNCNSGWAKYALNNGLSYITLPNNGTYVISFWVQAYNNNGGSVEWNTLQFHLNYMPPGQTNQLLPNGEGQLTVGQNGGGCSNCSKYNVSDLYWTTIPPTYFPAGTQIWISGQVQSSGTSCGGNSVLIQAGGIGVTQQ